MIYEGLTLDRKKLLVQFWTRSRGEMVRLGGVYGTVQKNWRVVVGRD